MNRLTFIVWMGICLVAITSLDAQDASPEDVLRKASKAIDPQGKLAQAKAYRWIAKGQSENSDAVVNDFFVQDPKHVRKVWTLNIKGEVSGQMTILAGDKGWQKSRNPSGDRVEPLADLRLSMSREEIAEDLGQISPASLINSGFQLASGGKVDEQGQSAVIVTAKGKHGPPTSWYFSEKTGLLLRKLIVQKAADGKDFGIETLFENYRDVQGVLAPQKITFQAVDKSFRTEFTDVKLEVYSQSNPEWFKEPMK